MKKHSNKSTEDFLFAMLQIYEEGNSDIKLVDISLKLGISRAAATKMSIKLSSNSLIEKTRYSKIRLTKKGKKFAIEVARKHRIIEVFLDKKLGLSGKELEEQAHAMEHSINKKTLERLSVFMNNPDVCPHGKKTY
ncbi:MAG: metal-dependent transcriptional regulator [Candidatus Micrarchaeia archaeon]